MLQIIRVVLNKWSKLLNIDKFILLNFVKIIKNPCFSHLFFVTSPRFVNREQTYKDLCSTSSNSNKTSGKLGILYLFLFQRNQLKSSLNLYYTFQSNNFCDKYTMLPCARIGIVLAT